MKTRKSSGAATAVLEEPVPAAIADATERDYWHVNYMTRPYYVEGRSFGDYEPAYRYGWESSAKAGATTFEEAEKAHLESGWTAARGKCPYAWGDVREAVRDAWTHARRHLVR
jgi:hypothetical protein